MLQMDCDAAQLRTCTKIFIQLGSLVNTEESVL
jgi:hypothetical protein